jgi:hypothetical protein
VVDRKHVILDYENYYGLLMINMIPNTQAMMGKPRQYHHSRISRTSGRLFILLVVSSLALGAADKKPGARPVPTAPGNPAVGQAQHPGPAMTWREPYLNYAYLRRAWEVSGRLWVEKFSGIKWNVASRTWELDRQWPYETQVGPQAYYIDYATRGGANMGLLCHDIALLNELAEFYVAYEGRFTTVGAMRGMTQYHTSMLRDSGPDSTKTLIWVWVNGGTTFVRECDLCNSQFYHPVTRLLRIITTLQPSERTQAMQNFASWYAPVVTHDHLLRLLWGNGGWLVNKYRNTPNYISDRDLWLIAGAAEILGANANDPNVVPLTSTEKSQLQQAVQVAVQALQMNYRTYYPGTRNFQGTVVGSVSYFNGEYKNDPDYAYSGYTGQAFPTPSDAKVQQDASWDISHFYRIPVFLRSLYDNRIATGVDFPSTRDVELLTNQLMYRVFKGDLNRPLFNNFFDGSNGWYRVGYHGPSFGYPPAELCDSRNGNRPCLTDGAVQGWGLVAQFNPDLTELLHSLVKLAAREDLETRRFEDRYYWYNGQSYSFQNPQGQTQYPVLLFFILSAVPEKLHGCGAP